MVKDRLFLVAPGGTPVEVIAGQVHELRMGCGRAEMKP